MPKFEANMNYIPSSPPSSMKQCNKSATVKFPMELLLTTTTGKLLRSGSNRAVVQRLLPLRRDSFISQIADSFETQPT